jgi:uncharacterized membrane protein
MTNRDAADGLNLSSHRATDSVWNRRGWKGSHQELSATRSFAGAAGIALIVQGMRRRSRTGGVLGGLGGVLAWWAVTGGNLSDARRWFMRGLEPWFGSKDLVQESSSDSFPASDAPSWTPTVATSIKPADRGI